MNLFWYSRIANACFVVCIVAAFLIDSADYGWKILIGICGLLAAVTSVAMYFYNQYLWRRDNGSDAPNDLEEESDLF